MTTKISRVREHFGSGRLTLHYQRSVFINCPFDAEYTPLFDAIVFSAVCCGFMPRSALESGDVAESRMARIARALFNSKYSIHDLARCKGEGSENLARFNMPLELGIAMGHRFTTQGTDREHDWLVLVPDGHAYQRFVSDLSGFDPKSYDHSVEDVVRKVTTWLSTRRDAVKSVTPKTVQGALGKFRRARSKLATDWGTEVPWADICLVAIKIAERL